MVDDCPNEGMDCWLPDDGDQASCAYCPGHAFDAGFCKSCGQFWGGIESFEFLNGGYCDECKSEMEHNDALDTDEPDEDWDPYDDY